MPRKPIIRTEKFPYHITSRCINKEWFALPLNQVWDICLNSMKEAYLKYKVEIISFVLMNNHYHLLVQTPNCDIDKFMYEFNKRIGQEIRYKTNRLNQVFGGKYKWCLIKSQKYFLNCYRYVYQNPLRAKIVKDCSHYPFSTLYYLYNRKPFIIPLNDKYGFKDDFSLSWLNEKVDDKEIESIKFAFKKPILDKLINRQTRKPLNFMR